MSASQRIKCFCFLLVLCVLVAQIHAARPAGNPVKKLVMMMMENRSFDHRLGWFQQLGFDIDGLTGEETSPIDPSNPSKGTCQVHDTADPYDTINGDHSYWGTKKEQYGSEKVVPGPPPMNGFAYANHGNCSAMQAIPVRDIPVSHALLENFVVFDRWFSSFPGPTEVNRMFVNSAQSDGWCQSPKDATYITGFPQRSLLRHLSDNGISWKVYMEDLVSANLFFKDVRNVRDLTRFHSFATFLADCKQGTLPQYSIIEPRYFSIAGYPANDEHPSNHNIYQGELLFKRVYDSLRASPDWNQTALLITYDEAGGLYDHVPSPVDAPNPVPGLNCTHTDSQKVDADFAFNRLGVRVPAFLISPWVPKGRVEHDPKGPFPNSRYEHSSVPATVRDLFGLGTNLTERDAWAGSFASLFTELDEPRTDCPLTMPMPPQLAPHIQARLDREHLQPLTDLHRTFIQGIAGLNGEVYHGEGIETEGEGAEYVNKQWRILRQRMGLPQPLDTHDDL